MVKKILTLLSLCGCLVCANAKKQYMTIEQKNGEKYSFLLDENPEITYSDGNLIVNENGKNSSNAISNITTSFAISSVKNYHFTETVSVDTRSSNELRIVKLSESTIEVQNANSSTKVMLVNINGAIMFESTTNAEGSVTITLPEHKGVYLLSVGSRSLKVIRK